MNSASGEAARKGFSSLEGRIAPHPRVGSRTEPAQTAWFVFLAALAMTVFEGAFRKWVFPGGGVMKELMYFSKDIIFAGLLFLPKRGSPSRAWRVFGSWLLPGSVLFVLGAALSSLHGVNVVGAVLTAL